MPIPNTVDEDRSASLSDVGGPGYWAAVIIARDGSEHFALADIDAIGDENVRYYRDCKHVPHEQLGPLPPDIAQRLA